MATTTAEVKVTAAVEEEVTAPAAAAPAKGTHKGKAKGKGKAKKKGKAKAKGKKGKKGKRAMKAPAAEGEGADGEEAVAKPKKLGFKALVMEQIGDRGIDEVLAEVRAKVATYEACIQDALHSQEKFDKEAEEAKKQMEVCSQKVDGVVQRETVALEKLKASRTARLEAQQKVLEAKAERMEVEKKLVILDLETNGRAQVVELENARAKAREAAEAAKKALADSKIAELEAKEAIKKTSATNQDAYIEKLKESAEADGQAAGNAKEAKKAEKVAAQEMAHELKELEKQRQDRDKARQMKFREAAGLIKKRLGTPTKALTDGSTPSKAARTDIENVD